MAPVESAVQTQEKPMDNVQVEDVKDVTQTAASATILATIASLSPEERKVMERKLVRKIDLRLMPTTILLYILNYIDRNNIAAARLQGLEADTQLVGTDYNTVISIYFVGYILMQIPSNLCLSYFRPSLWIPGWVCVWGLISALTALAHSYSGLVAVRFFLGFAEAPYFAGAMFLFSGWYTRKELSFRVSLLFCGILLSGAFGNLLAAGILAGLKTNNRGIAAWRWLFIIEGAFTVLFAGISTFILPDWPENTKWLNEEERALAALRLAEESGDEVQTTAKESLKMAVTDYKVWLFVWLQVLLQALSSLTNWFPSLVQTLGYNTTNTLLLTAPPYIFAAIIGGGNSLWSDYRGVRSTHMMVPLSFAIVGFIIPLATLNTAARYVSMFLMLGGVFGGIQVSFAWTANTISRPRGKRAVAISMANCISQTSQIWAAYMYQSKFANQYKIAWSVNITITALAILTAFTLRIILGRLNKKMDREEIQTHSELEHANDPALAERTVETHNVPHSHTTAAGQTVRFRYII